MNWLQIVPIIILFGLLGALAAFLGTFFFAKARPATDEAVIGNYEVHHWHSGETVTGLMSLAQKSVSLNLLLTIERAIEKKIIDAPPALQGKRLDESLESAMNNDVGGEGENGKATNSD